ILLIVAGMFAFFKRGEGMYGVEFTGGSFQEYRFQKPIGIDKLRNSLAEIGYGTSTIQKVGDTNEVIIRAAQKSEKPIAEKLKKDYPDNPYEVLRLESIGPVIGKELKTKAIWAVVLSLLGIWIYVVWRFDFKFAFGAILSLFHDALTTI